MSQAGVVARLAVRELWISFRLFVIIAAFIAAGTLVALLPAPLPVAASRLAVGLAAATLMAAAVAAASIAEERRAGRAGWLVTRSLARPSLVAGWFVAVASIALVGLAGASLLGWLTFSSVTLRLEAGGFVSLAAGLAATLVAAVGLGILAGTVLPVRTAVVATIVAATSAGALAWFVSPDPTLVPGGAFVALARISEPGTALGPGLRATGIGLGCAALVLAIGHVAVERAEL